MIYPPLQLCRTGRRLILSGYLRTSCDAKNLRAELRANTDNESLIVDAQDAGFSPEGVTIWITSVMAELSHVRLHYLDSQLADLLQLDSRYKHPNSCFDPSDLIADPKEERTQAADRQYLAPWA